MTYQPSPLTSLPIEVLDLILSSIDDRKDLISVATTTRSFSSLIIPYHAEYRTLHIGTKSPDVWAHLAMRADLARNIRMLYMVEEPKGLSPVVDRMPHTLVTSFNAQQCSDEGEDERVKNIARAVRNMDSLQAFVWVQPWSSGLWCEKSANYNLVWHALSQSRSLKDVKVVDKSRGLTGKVIDNDCPVCSNFNSLY